jgi:hypothetical protein
LYPFLHEVLLDFVPYLAEDCRGQSRRHYGDAKEAFETNGNGRWPQACGFRNKG